MVPQSAGGTSPGSVRGAGDPGEGLQFQADRKRMNGHFSAGPGAPNVRHQVVTARGFTMRETRSADGSKIAYRVLGSGELAVVLVHGWTVSGAVFDSMIEQWNPVGLRLVIPDLRGAGHSDKPESGYTLEAYAADVLAVADQEGLDRFALVGHSMGGQIAQLVAARHPHRLQKLLLLNTVPAAGLPLPEGVAELFRGSGDSREAQEKILDMSVLSLPGGARQRFLDDVVTVSPACVAASFDAWTAGGFADELDQIDVPTLVVATDDAFLPPAFLTEQVVSRIRGARLAVLPGCGHYPQCERPRETAAVLDAFLAGLS